MPHAALHHRQHITQWRASGLSRAAYCRQHGIVYHTTRSWNKPTEEGSRQTEPQGFIEVLRPTTTITESTSPGHATIAFPRGAVLRIPVGADPQWVGRVIVAVSPC